MSGPEAIEEYLPIEPPAWWAHGYATRSYIMRQREGAPPNHQPIPWRIYGREGDVLSLESLTWDTLEMSVESFWLNFRPAP